MKKSVKKVYSIWKKLKSKEKLKKTLTEVLSRSWLPSTKLLVRSAVNCSPVAEDMVVSSYMPDPLPKLRN